MFCGMRLSKFAFDVQYKKELLNTKDDALSCLRSFGETIVPIDADISTYSLLTTSPQLALNACPASSPALRWPPIPLLHSFLLLLTRYACAKMIMTFVARYRLVFVRERVFLFALNCYSILFRSVDRFGQVVIPHSLVSRVLHLSHHARMAGLLSGRRPYQFSR